MKLINHDRLRWRYGWRYSRAAEWALRAMLVIAALAALAGCTNRIDGGSSTQLGVTQSATTRASSESRAETQQRQALDIRQESTIETSAAGTPGETVTTVETPEVKVVVSRRDPAATQPAATERHVTVIGASASSAEQSAAASDAASSSKRRERYRAATQPSVEGDGEIGLDGWEASVRPVVDKFKNGWRFGLLCIGAAIFVGWWLKRYVLAVLIGSMGCIAILNPDLALWLNLAAFFIAVWASWRMNREQIAGTQTVLERVKPETREAYKATMRSKHSAATQAAIKAATGKT